MKKLAVLLVILATIGVGVFLYYQKSGQKNNLDKQTQTSKENVLSEKATQPTLVYQDKTYGYDYFEVDNTDDLFLYNNLEDKLPLSEAKNSYGCKSLVSGGFYTKDYQPIGLFISQGKTIRNNIASSLFDGYLSINEYATPRITRIIPADRLRIGLQSGPILIENAKVLPLSMSDDAYERRIVAAVTGENKLVFLIFYNPDSVFLGPLLADLPSITQEFSKVTSIDIADAINLDGGTASGMISANNRFVEATQVGSIFCLK